VAAACLAILVWVMQLWRADLPVPFGYRGSDSFFHFMQAKSLLDNGWYLENPFIGMPTGMEFYDFPLTENLHFLVMKLVSLAAADFGRTVNGYYLLTFPLSAMTALGVFRHFRMSSLPAAAGAILFAFLPYHFWRGQEHIFLASYHLVPLAVLIILWVALGDDADRGAERRGRPGTGWPTPRVAAGLAIGLAVGFAGVYYAFFAAVLLGVVGGIHGLRTRQLRPLLCAAGFTAAILAGVLANVAPNLAYMWHHGKNPELYRVASEAEPYGLKIVQLLLPVRGHHLPALAGLAETYARGPLVNENQTAALGAVGGLGFLALLAWPVLGGRLGGQAPLLERLSLLTYAALLLATIGGFGALIALLGFPLIRAYNRMSVFIGFFSLFAIVVLLDRLGRRLHGPGLSHGLFGAMVVALTVGGVLDQTGRRIVPPYPELEADYRSDRDFVRRIEGAVPPGAMIFQLPYVPFPESAPPVHRLRDFHLFRGYLHSTGLRWSYGTMKGRPGDAWQRKVAAMPPEEMAEALAVVGFAGIYLDRNGYADGGREVEGRLAARLRADPLVSANGRLAFFDLGALAAELRQRDSPEAWRVRRRELLHPLALEETAPMPGPRGPREPSAPSPRSGGRPPAGDLAAPGGPAPEAPRQDARA